MMSTGLELNLFQKDILKPDGYSISVFGMIVGTLAINILSLALPVMTLQVYDRILPNPGSGTLPVLIMGVCLAIILEAALRLCRGYVMGRSGAAYEHRMACRAMHTVLNADLGKMEPHGAGEAMHRFAAIGKLKDFYNGYALTTLLELAFVPVFLTLMAFIAGSLAWVPLAVMLPFMMLTWWQGRELKKSLRVREEADDERFNFLIDALEGIHTIKSFAVERFFERRYEALEEKSTSANYDVTEVTARTFNIGAIFSHIMVAAVITFGAAYVLDGRLTTGALIATLLLSGRMMQPVQKALSLWARYQDYTLARENAVKILSIPQQPRPDAALTGQAAAPEGRLDIENVSFRYKETEPFLFKDVSFSLHRGEAALITGPAGCGKTAFLNLISGMYLPEVGRIQIDGHDVAAYPPEERIRHVGYVGTQSVIFRGTIRDNITCFGQVADAPAREVAALLRVDTDVARLPGGFDTFLTGTSADTIPPGLRQRITIVRVLASKPRLILFDNADRALDRAGYAMVYSLLARLKNKTAMIIVSEDRNIRALADRAFCFRDGSLIEVDAETSKGNIRPYSELRL